MNSLVCARQINSIRGHELKSQSIILNIGHLFNHHFMLIFASVAALASFPEWGLEYAELLRLFVPALIAYGVLTIPAGWLADRWDRRGMMVISFIGTGLASASVWFVVTPLHLTLCLLVLGSFAAIYHPVGLALIVERSDRIGVALAVNGIYGNLGVATAALLTAILVDIGSWRAAFLVPGILSIVTGLLYLYASHGTVGNAASPKATSTSDSPSLSPMRSVYSVFTGLIVVGFVGGWLFQSTTIALPRILTEALSGTRVSESTLGTIGFVILTAAAFAQLASGFLVEKIHVRSILAMLVALQIAFLLLLHELHSLPAVFVIFGLMLAIFGQIPLIDAIVGRTIKPEWRSRAFAIRNVTSFIASPLSLLAITWIHPRWGFGALYLCLATMTFASLVATRLMPDIRRQATSS